MTQLADSTRKLRYGIASFLVPNLKPLLDMRFRPMIGHLKDTFGNRPLIGCEIGVAGALNAKSMLEYLTIKKLYLIDPYVAYHDHGHYWTHYVKTEKEAHQRLHRWQEQIVWLKSLSSDAVLSIAEPLDFVYIDGNHSYSFVYADISSYYPLVHEAGVIGGHNFESAFPDVIRAVSNFCHPMEVCYCVRRVDWWIDKKVGLA